MHAGLARYDDNGFPSILFPLSHIFGYLPFFFCLLLFTSSFCFGVLPNPIFDFGLSYGPQAITDLYLETCRIGVQRSRDHP